MTIDIINAVMTQSDATLYFLYFNTDNDAMICDKRYLEVFCGGYCPLEHMKKSAPLDIPVMSKVMPVSFYLLKLPILPSFVIFRGSLRRIYLSVLHGIESSRLGECSGRQVEMTPNQVKLDLT